MKSPLYWILTFFIWFSHKLKRLAIKLTKWTGKSKVPVHPKHLMGEEASNYWYLSFLTKDDEVLDVGCGNGMNVLRASSRVKKAVGVELNERNFRDCQDLKRNRGVQNVEFVLGNAEKPLPFEDGCFDKVMFMDVMEHIYERQSLLLDIRRVLKPTGTMILSVPSCETTWRKFLKNRGVFSYSDPDHKIEYTKEGLIQELKGGGFEAIEWYSSVYDTPFVAFFDFIGGFHRGWYKKLHDWRIQRAVANPIESIGFRVICRPLPVQTPSLVS